jgi:hypothetical protein
MIERGGEGVTEGRRNLRKYERRTNEGIKKGKKIY